MRFRLPLGFGCTRLRIGIGHYFITIFAEPVPPEGLDHIKDLERWLLGRGEVLFSLGG